MPPSRSQKRRLEQASAAGPAETRCARVSSEERDAISLGLLHVRETGTPRGRGLFAAQPLSEGVYLGDYTGEVLTHEQYLERYPAEDARYVLAANTDYNIDASDPKTSSMLRFLNHSAQPNCYYDVQRIRRQREKRVRFFTLRDVRAGEELFFNYGEQYWLGRLECPV